MLALAGLAMVAAAIVVGTGGGEEPAAAGEIFLEAAATPGRDPFTEPMDPDPTTTSSVSTSTSAASTTTLAPQVVTQPTSGVAPPPGSPPYGGSGDDTVCDREALVAFLQAQPDRAAAWAGALGVAVPDIATYVRGLTPTVLLYDTRVTNHGFANGVATPRQSVLQAGTAVLVDAAGNPVVRCRCGNPLRPALPVAAPQLVGTPWPGFTPAAVVAVDQGATVSVTIQVTTGGAPSTTAAPASTATTTSSTDAPTTTADDEETTTTASGGPTAADVEGLVAVLTECAAGGPVEVLDVQEDPDLPGVFTVDVRVNGEDMLFTYQPATGDVGEGDRASAELLAACGVA